MEQTYGYAPTGADPRRFTPDEQANTPAEMDAWREALVKAEAGEPWINPRAEANAIIGTDVTLGDGRKGRVLHVSGSAWGMGVYTWEDTDQ